MYKKVMVIDDMQMDRFVAMHILTRFGFSENVILMETGPDGLAYLRTHEHAPSELPSVIFLDIQMPGMNGFAFLEKFEQMPVSITSACKVVMLTSSIDTRDITLAGRHKDVKHYIVKPLDKSKLDELPSILG